MRTTIFLLLAAVAGCSSESTGDGTCAERSGSYVVAFKMRSGDCGNLPEVVINVSGGDAGSVASDQQCTGSPGDTRACVATSDTTCTNAKTGYTMTTRGQVRWNADASNGSGTLEFIGVLKSGANDCRGTYDVTYRRQ